MDKKKFKNKKSTKTKHTTRPLETKPFDFDSDVSDSSTSSLIERIAAGNRVKVEEPLVQAEPIKIKKTTPDIKQVTPSSTTTSQPLLFQTESDAIEALGAMMEVEPGTMTQYMYVRYIKKMPEGNYRVYIKGGYVVSVKENETDPEKSFVILTNNPNHYINWVRSGGFDKNTRPSYSMPLISTKFYRKMEPDEVTALLTDCKTKICELEDKNNKLREEIFEKDQAINVLREELGHVIEKTKKEKKR